jgi:uncharacterized protein (TIGR03435 family)
MKVGFMVMLSLLSITSPALAQNSSESSTGNSDPAKKQFELEVFSVRTTPSEVPFLNLMVTKQGPRLKDSVPGAIKPVKNKTSKLGEGFYIDDNGERRFIGISMEEFAHLSTRLSPDYPVQDMTGLTGRYDFTLPLYDPQHDPDSEFSRPLDRMPLKGIGLMLKAGKGQAYVVNIDHIERPDPN